MFKLKIFDKGQKNISEDTMKPEQKKKVSLCEYAIAKCLEDEKDINLILQEDSEFIGVTFTIKGQGIEAVAKANNKLISIENVLKCNFGRQCFEIGRSAEIKGNMVGVVQVSIEALYSSIQAKLAKRQTIQ